MDSYNCFYSALYYMLEQCCPGASKLLINNRWQFFYSQTDKYSDDFRFVGEFPLLYDKAHLALLKEQVGVNVSFSNMDNENSANFFHRLGTKNEILFVNKAYIIAEQLLLKKRNCVTTVIAKRVNHRCSILKTFDDDLDSDILVDNEKLYHSWRCASEYAQLNTCNINIQVLKSIDMSSAYYFAKSIAIKSLLDYLAVKQDGKYFFGNYGLKLFAHDVLNWENMSYKRMVDCSLYLNTIVKQRIFFASMLTSVLENSSMQVVGEINKNFEDWNKLKKLFFVVGMRKQSGAAKQLSVSVNALAAQEKKLVSNIIEVLYDHI